MMVSMVCPARFVRYVAYSESLPPLTSAASRISVVSQKGFNHCGLRGRYTLRSLDTRKRYVHLAVFAGIHDTVLIRHMHIAHENKNPFGIPRYTVRDREGN